MMHIPAQREPPFWFNVNTYSGSMWTLIPAQSEHLFWFNLNTHSGLNVNTFRLFSGMGVQIARMSIHHARIISNVLIINYLLSYLF